ncbi:MAG TPA: hypothetical protein VI136_08985 [Verrucomicrobiae bacterium]
MMNDNEPVPTIEERLQAGHYFRQMLSNVEPDHVPEMLYMLYLFGHGGKPLRVPPGHWRMPMPFGYMLHGEGPVGVAIEPPPIREEMPMRPRFNTLSTAEVLALCAQARNMKRPERDEIVAQLYGLVMEQCEAEAVEAIELLTCYLIEGEVE